MLPLLLSLALTMICPLPQSGGVAAKPEVTKPVVTAAYRLGPDDALSIKVLNFDNLSTTLVVPPDGNVVLPLLEPIQVTGMSVDELKQLIVDRWRKYVINPAVYVTLTTKRKENILFYGFVTHVGVVEYRPALHLVEALAESGGATQNGDLATLTLTHKDGGRQVLDLSHPEKRAGTEADVLLQQGDVVYVPELRQEISVLGEVSRPGVLTYKEDMTVLDALTSAGNVHLETADLAAATLRHNGQESRIDLDAMLRHGVLTDNVKLSPGDRIMVPEIRNRVYIFGAVSAPGYYPYKDGDRVMDALKAAGGPREQANMRKINLIRIDKTRNHAELKPLNIDRVLSKGDLAGNVALQPGDILFIPDRKKAFGFQELVGMVSGLSVVSNIQNLFR